MRTTLLLVKIGLIAGLALVAIGALLSIAAPGAATPALSIAALGILLLVLGMAPGPKLRAGRRDERERELRSWQLLKSLSILLNLIAVLAIVLLVAALLIRGGWVSWSIETVFLQRVLAAFTAVLVIDLVAAYLLSLRIPLEPDQSGTTRGAHGVLLAMAAALVVVAILIDAIGLGGLGRADATVVLLGAAAVAALDGFVARSLPTVYILLSEEREHYRGTTYFSKQKAVLAPTLTAFSLLFLVFLGFLLYGLGFFGAFQAAAQNRLVLVVVGLVLVGFVGSIAWLMRLSRSDDDIRVVAKPQEMEGQTGRMILIGSLVVAGLLAALAAMLRNGTALGPLDRHAFVDVLALATLAALGPYGFYVAHQHRRVRRMEARFPDFLRDIASSHKGGLTLPQAVSIAARGDYGPLSPEIKTMADQMSWNVSFAEALQRFADRVRTPLVQRTVSLVLEADRSGGSTTDVLFAAARDARELKVMEDERSLSMTLYTVVIYLTFLVFLVVAAVLFHRFVPQIVEAGDALQAADSGGTGPAAGQSTFSGGLSILDYRAFYFLASLVQGVGGGMVAGMMGSGRASLGLRHAFLMAGIAYVTFAFVL